VFRKVTIKISILPKRIKTSINVLNFWQIRKKTEKPEKTVDQQLDEQIEKFSEKKIKLKNDIQKC
jgi:hypothetical protein